MKVSGPAMSALRPPYWAPGPESSTRSDESDAPNLGTAYARIDWAAAPNRHQKRLKSCFLTEFEPKQCPFAPDLDVKTICSPRGICITSY